MIALGILAGILLVYVPMAGVTAGTAEKRCRRAGHVRHSGMCLSTSCPADFPPVWLFWPVYWLCRLLKGFYSVPKGLALRDRPKRAELPAARVVER